MPKPKAPNPINLELRSVVGYYTRRPAVELTIDETTVQLSPEEAIQFGANLVECAAVAEADAFILHFMVEKIGVDEKQGAAFLGEFREYRQQLRQARSAEPWQEIPHEHDEETE